MIKILDLGCGTNKVKDSIGLDNVYLPGVDIVHDLLDFPYPFSDSSFDRVYLRHVIEHFSHDDGEKILLEVKRILSPNGIIEISVPHAFSIAAYTDPTHKRFFTFRSGEFWNVNNPKAYYLETISNLMLVDTICNLTWFDWKGYRLKKLDKVLSKLLSRIVNKLLKNINNPSLADRIIKKKSIQFVEIVWKFKRFD